MRIDSQEIALMRELVDVQSARAANWPTPYGPTNKDMEMAPPAGSPVGVEARVAADIAARQRIGILKYGTTVADNPLPLREWLEHAYQESLDLPIYLKRAIEEIDRDNANVDLPDTAAQDFASKSNNPAVSG